MPEKSVGFAIGNLRARENRLLKKNDLSGFRLLRLRPGGSLPDSRSENRVQRGQYDPRLHLPQPLSEYDEAHRPLFPGNAGKTPGFIPGKNR